MTNLVMNEGKAPTYQDWRALFTCIFVSMGKWSLQVYNILEIAEMADMAGIAQKTQISRIGTQLEPIAFLDHIE